MRYVLDANAAAFWVLKSPLAPKAVLLRDEYRRRVHELIAPSHFPDEIASALTKAERQKLIRVGKAAGLIQDILRTPPMLYPTDALLD